MPEKEFKRIITWDVVPADAEADFDACQKMVQAIAMPGLEWVGTPAVVPHVFGLSKMVMTSEVSCPEDLSEAIQEQIEALSTEDLDFSATIAGIDFVEMEEPKKPKKVEAEAAPAASDADSLKAELEEVKAKNAEQDKEIAALKEAVQALQAGGGGKKGGKGAPAEKKEKAPQEALPEGMDKKMAAKCDQDGTAKAKEFKKMAAEYGNLFYAGGVNAPEGSLAGLERSTVAANKSAPELGKLLVSEGSAALAVTIYVPAELADKVNRKEWLDAALEAVGGIAVAAEVNEREDFTALSILADGAAGRFPIKMKDDVIASGFGFIREKGLIADADDDDEPDMNMLGEC